MQYVFHIQNLESIGLFRNKILKGRGWDIIMYVGLKTNSENLGNLLAHYTA
jgi:hypothetical protein